MKSQLYIGMISGTSRDGADAALVRFEGDCPKIEEAICIPYPSELADKLSCLIRTGQRPEPVIQGELGALLAGHFAETVQQLLKLANVNASAVTAIGSHGQTVWHDPEGEHPESIQLGDPARIAKISGIVTVGDFRSADIDAGGQGAPLAPLLHRALFSPSKGSGQGPRVVLNLGGIANISIIDDTGSVSGFDTGPANCLLDAWIQQHLQEPFDRNGEWAKKGRVQSGLLAQMLADPYFQKPAPKSTGVEYFNLAWIENFEPGRISELRDVQATLVELTAVSVADSIRPHAPSDVLVCGGGVHNAYLLERLRAQLPGTPVKSTADLGLDPDWIEAVLFAWLARERLAARTLDTGGITGAEKPILLGVVSNPG